MTDSGLGQALAFVSDIVYSTTCCVGGNLFFGVRFLKKLELLRERFLIYLGTAVLCKFYCFPSCSTHSCVRCYILDAIHFTQRYLGTAIT